MTRRLAAEDAACALEHREHVAVADLGAQKLDAQSRSAISRPRLVITVPTTGPRRASALAPIAGQDVQELIAIDEIAALVDHDDAVAVAVERDADMCARRR